MTSFCWKKKSGEKINKRSRATFEEASDVPEFNEDEVEDWLTLAPRKKAYILEDSIGKSNRLKKEGITLAQADRYWEALRKWEEALQLTPDDASLHEMKAQSYLSLNELYPAVGSATKAVEVDPTWWPAYQTLGRAHLNLGEVRMAIKAFSRAIHMNPSNEELWKEDFHWALSLLQKKKQIDVEFEDLCNRDQIKITELHDTEGKAVNESRSRLKQGLLDTHLLHMNSGPLVPASSLGNTKELGRLPPNYVYMRD